MNKEEETESILQSIIYIEEKIELKKKELISLKNIYYTYKNHLAEIYPNENIDVIEFLGKKRILKNRRDDISNI